MNKPRVLVISPIPTDACSSWRCLGPLSKLSDQLEIIVAPQDVSWVQMNSCDIVFMHRPFSEQHVQLMQMARQFGRKVWVDYDDDLLNVMDDNPTYMNYGRSVIKESVKKCLQLADITTVTTEDLRDLYVPYCPDIRIVPNAWDNRFITVQEKPIMTNIVFWRGSDSHQRDLLDHANGIVNAYREFENQYRFDFIGYRPWFLLQSMPKAVFHGALHFKSFYDYMGSVSPDIVHIPLHNHVFNYSKSNIAAMEGALSGAMIICPDWKEWQIPGALQYSDPNSYAEAMRTALRFSEEEKRNRRNETVKFFTEQRNLDIINKKRLEVIFELLGKK